MSATIAEHSGVAALALPRVGIRRLRWQKLLPALLAVGFLLLYALHLTRWYTFDSVAYAYQIRQGYETGRLGWFFHPHHLLFNWLGFAFWRALVAFGFRVDALTAVQVMNAGLGGVGLGLFYHSLESCRASLAERKLPSLVALGATLVLAASFGYWVAATDARVNIAGIAALILTLGCAWRLSDRLDPSRTAAAALSTVAAIAMHQSHGLLMVPCVFAILVSRHSRHERLRWTLAYLAAVALGTLTLYVGSGILTGKASSLSSFTDWLFAYPNEGRWWSFDVANNLAKDVAALEHSLISELPTSSEGPAADWVLASANRLRSVFVIGLAALPCGYLGWQRKSPAPARTRRRIGICLALATPYAAFFTVWNPGYWPFWLPVLISLVAALALACINQSRTVRAWCSFVLIAFAIPLFLTNYHSTLERRTDADRNPFLRACADISRHASAGDFLLVSGVGPHAQLESYSSYFTPCTTISLTRSADERRLSELLNPNAAPNGRIFAHREILSPASWRLLKQGSLTSMTREALLSPFVATPIPGTDIVELEPRWSADRPTTEASRP